jgi:DNA-directed RNA polymerase specialized sigma24 family protein
MAALKACMQKLPDRDRQLLEEVYWQGRDYEAAATNCGMALQTAYNRMRILRLKLLECVSRRLLGEERGSQST